MFFAGWLGGGEPSKPAADTKSFQFEVDMVSGTSVDEESLVLDPATEGLLMLPTTVEEPS
jgi:hypothetical protein